MRPLKDFVNRRFIQRSTETPTDRSARRTANATIAMAVFTIILAVVSGKTLLVLENQLHEMHEGGTDTHNLAIAAVKQADEAKKQSEDTAKIANNSSAQVGELKAEAKATNRLVRATESSFRQGNRAYLGVKDARYFQLTPGGAEGSFNKKEASQTTSLGRIPEFELQLVNTGNSPALDVTGEFTLTIIAPPLSWENLPAISSGDKLRSLKSKRDVPKDAMVVYNRVRPLSPLEYSDILNQRKFLVMYGTTSYKDIFGNVDETDFCFLLDVNKGDTSSCPGHNHIR